MPNPDNALTRAQGMHLVAAIGEAMEAVRMHQYPRLVVETITSEDDDDIDEDESRTRLRCPYCERIVDGQDDIVAVDFSERWNHSCSDDEDIENETIIFSTGDDDYGSTVYYRCDHCGNPIDLPEGWTEDWS